IMVNTYGTGVVDDNRIAAAVAEVFDLRPFGLIKMLNLLQPIYRPTATYGHFGRPEFPWEKTDRVEALKDALK
ncbi:MAG TPA: methionine adenosyltransferase, partial [Succinivibrionaceae bacterium]|nr:methionine adenosyltransferase [Succinivibrionaceae bacterium]